MPLKNYLDFAENDYQFLIASYERGAVANVMGAIAQNVCEKYMKHLIDEYNVPTNKEEEEKKREILSIHKLNHLFNYIRDNLDVGFSPAAKEKMRVINGFYFTARYPGDGCVELAGDDIEDCIEAVKVCRKETLELIETLEKKKTTPLTEKIEAVKQRGVPSKSGRGSPEQER